MAKKKWIAIWVGLAAVLGRGQTVPVLEAPGNQVRVGTAAELAAALVNAPRGRTILLADGTYNLTGYEPLRVRNDSITLYGESRDPSKVILKGQGFASANVDEEMITLEASRTTLAYLTIRDVRANGLKLQGSNHDLLVHNVRFLDICERSIKSTALGAARNGTVRYCLFEQITPLTSSIPNLRFNGDYIAGMDMMRIEGWKIHDNVFKNIRGMNGVGRAGVFLWRGCRGVTVERNVFLGCDRAVSFGNPAAGDPDMSGGILRNNFIVAGAGNAVEICNSDSTLVAHNTVFSANPAYARTIFFYNGGAGNGLKNNLVLGKLFIVGSAPDTAANLFLSAAGSAPGWFSDPSTGELHLTAAAGAALDRARPLPEVAEDIDGEIRGGLPDIGADEFGRPTSTAPRSPGKRQPGKVRGSGKARGQRALFRRAPFVFSASGRRQSADPVSIPP